METQTLSPIIAGTIGKEAIFHIPNFLSEEECRKLLSSRIPLFQKANTHYPTYYRNNDRHEECNQDLALRLYKRLNEVIDQHPENHGTSYHPKDAVGLNKKLRWCRYSAGQHFSKHQDGVYYPSDETATRLTFLLFLNSQGDFSGGETQFFRSNNESKPSISIAPKRGSLLLFNHRIWHRGATVKHGHKYILRSDLIFMNPALEPRNDSETKHLGYIWQLKNLNEQEVISMGRDCSVRFWNRRLEHQQSVKLHRNSVLDVLPLNQDAFISTGRDMQLLRWNKSGTVTMRNQLPEMLLRLVPIHHGFMAGGTSGQLFHFNYDLQELFRVQLHEDWIWDILLIRKQFILTAGGDGKLILHRSGGQRSTIISHEDEGLMSLAASPSGDCIAVGTERGEIIVYSISRKFRYIPKIVELKRLTIHSDIVRQLFFADEDTIVSAAEDNTVRQTSIASSTSILLQRHQNKVQTAIRFQNRCLSAGFDGEIKRSELAGRFE